MIYLLVSGQRLQAYYDAVFTDSQNYLTMKTELDDKWEGCTVTAVFESASGIKVSAILGSIAAPQIGKNEYRLPDEMIGSPYFTVALIGNKGDMRITTNSVQITVGISGYGEGRAPVAPSPDEYEQLLDICLNAKDIASSLRRDADSGFFNGKDGKDGIDGEKGEKGDKGDKGDVGPGYVLTTDDKIEIAGIALALIPDGDEVSY